MNKHLFIDDGVNLVGRCSNPDCRIYKVVQKIELGLGTFSLNKEVYCQKCIVCSKSLACNDVTNIIFFNCDFKIEGVTEGKKVDNDGTTGANKAITYKDEQPEELTNWNYLEVTASEL